MICTMIFLCILAYALNLATGQRHAEGQYILNIRPDMVTGDAFIRTLTTEYNFQLKNTYQFGSAMLLHVQGSAGNISKASRLEPIKSVDHNDYIYGAQACDDISSPGTWGLDRIDQVQQLESNDPTNPESTYAYGPDIGGGVRVYVLDTGIDIFHSKFNERAKWGYVAESISNPNPGDFHGHGTHVAGIVGSDTHGVAKGVTLVAVKILDDDNSGTMLTLLDGLNWVLNNDTNRGDRSIVVASLAGSGHNSAVEAAINALVSNGVTCVVAAGGSNANSCSYTPAFIPAAITVGAHDVNDITATFTNWGSCVDLFAPGVEILSVEPLETTGLRSGTSAACAHVAGCAARYISSQSSSPTPAQVQAYLTEQAIDDALMILPGQEEGTINKLLFCDCFF